MDQKLRDAFLNIGFPQFAEKENINDFEKTDIKEIVNQIKKFDKLCKSKDLNKYETRNTIKNFVNSWCDCFRCSSLIIK